MPVGPTRANLYLGSKGSQRILSQCRVHAYPLVEDHINCCCPLLLYKVGLSPAFGDWKWITDMDVKATLNLSAPLAAEESVSASFFKTGLKMVFRVMAMQTYSQAFGIIVLKVIKWMIIMRHSFHNHNEWGFFLNVFTLKSWLLCDSKQIIEWNHSLHNLKLRCW